MSALHSGMVCDLVGVKEKWTFTYAAQLRLFPISIQHFRHRIRVRTVARMTLKLSLTIVNDIKKPSEHNGDWLAVEDFHRKTRCWSLHAICRHLFKTLPPAVSRIGGSTISAKSPPTRESRVFSPAHHCRSCWSASRVNAQRQLWLWHSIYSFGLQC